MTNEQYWSIIAVFFIFIGVLTIFYPLFAQVDTRTYKANRQLRAVKVINNGDTTYYIVQQKLYYTNWYVFYGKWYTIEYANKRTHDKLEDAERVIKYYIDRNKSENQEKYNKKVKEVEVVIKTEYK